MKLVTARLVLRELELRDFAAMREFDTDPEVQRYRGSRTVTPEHTRAYLERVIATQSDPERRRYHLGITLAGEDRVLGGVMIFITNPELREAELGYDLHRAHWGRGLVSEAALALLGLAFDQLGMHRVWARCNPENIGSWRVMEKIGMRREGLFRECELVLNEWRDILFYAILDHEWRAGR